MASSSEIITAQQGWVCAMTPFGAVGSSVDDAWIRLAQLHDDLHGEAERSGGSYSIAGDEFAFALPAMGSDRLFLGCDQFLDALSALLKRLYDSGIPTVGACAHGTFLEGSAGLTGPALSRCRVMRDQIGFPIIFAAAEDLKLAGFAPGAFADYGYPKITISLASGVPAQGLGIFPHPLDDYSTDVDRRIVEEPDASEAWKAAREALDQYLACLLGGN